MTRRSTTAALHNPPYEARRTGSLSGLGRMRMSQLDLYSGLWVVGDYKSQSRVLAPLKTDRADADAPASQMYHPENTLLAFDSLNGDAHCCRADSVSSRMLCWWACLLRSG